MIFILLYDKLELMHLVRKNLIALLGAGKRGDISADAALRSVYIKLLAFAVLKFVRVGRGFERFL